MNKLKILAFAILSVVSVSSFASANYVIGEPEIMYNNAVAPDTPNIIIRISPDPRFTSNIESCMHNGEVLEWYLNFDNDVRIAEQQLKVLEWARANRKIVELRGLTDVCLDGQTKYTDTITDLYPRHETTI